MRETAQWGTSLWLSGDPQSQAQALTQDPGVWPYVETGSLQMGASEDRKFWGLGGHGHKPPELEEARGTLRQGSRGSVAPEAPPGLPAPETRSPGFVGICPGSHGTDTTRSKRSPATSPSLSLSPCLSVPVSSVSPAPALGLAASP